VIPLTHPQGAGLLKVQDLQQPFHVGSVVDGRFLDRFVLLAAGSNEVEGDVLEDREGLDPVSPCNAAGILMLEDVLDPVELVLDRPVPPHSRSKDGGPVTGQAAEVVALRVRGFPLFGAPALHENQAPHPRPPGKGFGFDPEQADPADFPAPTAPLTGLDLVRRALLPCESLRLPVQ